MYRHQAGTPLSATDLGAVAQRGDRGRRMEGPPLKPIFEEAGLLEDTVEIFFTGHTRGIDQDVEQDYERSLTPEEAPH
jgi:hypothetical protein